MATGMVLSVAQTLFAALQCKELRELCSMFGYESQLDALQRTVTTIKAVLLDVESKHQDLTNEGQDWIDKLKDAVYDADDLFDEFAIVAQRHKRVPGGKISKKVRAFFSGDNQLLFAATTSRKIKKLREMLDGIAKDRNEFGFSDVYKPVKRRDETWSYVHEHSIIGRDADKEAIVEMLLRESDSSVRVQENVSFVTIVGFGGLGKTALSQLVFNDNRIVDAFDMRMWVCVSEEFCVKEILSKMLLKDGLKLEELQQKVRQKIEGKRYLLVLDDVWNENLNDWDMLRNFLFLGGKGSKVLVTSRSKRVASVTGKHEMYELEGLSEESSWNLFKRKAFDESKEQEETQLVEIGKEIVKKCANVPLAIMVVGSLLYGQEKSKWRSFLGMDFSKMGHGKDSIMPVLKFSYYDLTPPLKSCLSFCALFPKDYIIVKRDLLSLWLAEGCLDLPDDGRSMEDVGEDYFFTLLQRCFFQDVVQDGYDGEIYSCKMHDLIHDLTREVAGKESLIMDTDASHFDEKTRHLSMTDGCSVLLNPSDYSLRKMRNMRSFLKFSNPSNAIICGSNVTTVLATCRRLRVLHLQKSHGIRSLLTALSDLVHLRYLDLSRNNFETLPRSITKLYNLQVLKLGFCSGLKELPDDLSELVNLRHLDIQSCTGLTHMPPGMDKMTCLHTLTMFVLGGLRRNSRQVEVGQLRDLKALINLRDELEIQVNRSYLYDHETNAEEGGYLLNKVHIKTLKIEEMEIQNLSCLEPVVLDERLLEGLQPHRDLKEIYIGGFLGIKLPRWAASLATSLPYIVRITLCSFQRLQHLPILSPLHHLKYLAIFDLLNVEYMEGYSSNHQLTTFFASLEELRLKNLPKLKGWWSDEYKADQAGIPSFPHLSNLELEKCPNMKSFPGCPHLKSLRLHDFNEELTFCGKREQVNPTTVDIDCNNNNSGTNNSEGPVFNLEYLVIDNVGLLSFLFGESIRHFGGHLVIDSFDKDSVQGGWGGLEYMINLQCLTIEFCDYLDLEGGIPWKSFGTLFCLKLWNLQKVVNLPKGLQYLTSLQSLQIQYCKNLEALPEWLDCLTSLRSLQLESCHKLSSLPEAICRLPSLTVLDIWQCDRLMERCREPNGKDWPKICHIPHLRVHN